MSDTRFTLIGVGLVFAGFVVLGGLGGQFFNASVEAEEFGDCYEYFEDQPPEKISCDVALQDKTAFFALVLGLIGAGIFSLVKGARGKWDQKVRPEDMLGPGAQNNTDSEDDDSTKSEKDV